MFFKITRKEYNTLKGKYLDLQNELEDKNMVINTLKNEVKELKRKTEEYKYREKKSEEDIAKLNNAINGLLERVNEISLKNIELKKKLKEKNTKNVTKNTTTKKVETIEDSKKTKGRPRKVKEEK